MKTFGHKVCRLISALLPVGGNTPESVVPLKTAFLYLECGIAADLSLLHKRDTVYYLCEHVRGSIWRESSVPMGKQLSSGCTVPGHGAALGQSLEQVREVPDLQEQRMGVLQLWSWVSTWCNLTCRNEIHTTHKSPCCLCGLKGDRLKCFGVQ